MKKFLSLLLILGLYISTSAQPINDLCDALPETADIDAAKGEPVSYLNITISDAGMLNGNYPGWCVDTENGISTTSPYDDVPVYCSYETLPAGLLVSPDNLDLVNWILNNVSVGVYTMGDIQMAIWELISDVTLLPLPADNPGFWTYLGTITPANVAEIVSNATTYGEGYEPGIGDFIAVVFDPGIDVQTFIIPFLIYDPGCTLTQGYWKTHADPSKKKYDDTWDLIGGPGTTFYFSGDSYIGVFNTPVRGNKYYSLAHQFMAVQLNFENGADPTVVLDAYNAAKVLFETYTPAQVKADKDINDEFGSYIGILTDYNEGTIGPGHCDDKSTYADIETLTGSDMNIYPNPMTNSGTIDFTAENEAQTTVEMYNVMGQKVATLFDNPTQMGQKYQVKIDANRYQKGLYVVYLRNGSSTVTKKININ